MDISIGQIRQDLVQYFAYNACSISEVKGGSVGYTYKIDDRYFLKIYDTDLAVTERCTAHLQEQLTVLELLHAHTGLADRICYPIRTLSGGYFFAHDHIIGVLFNLINGKAIGYDTKYSPSDIEQLARMVKTLHGIDPSPFQALCPQETFCFDFLDELAAIISIRTKELPGGFGELVTDHAQMIMVKISQARRQAEHIKSLNLPFVLCHTDIHGGNLMKDKDDRLYLVDWENVLLAPKEADLFSFAEADYRDVFCQKVNLDAIAYYTVRRDLEDIWEFLRGLLNNEYDKTGQSEVYRHLFRIFRHISTW